LGAGMSEWARSSDYQDIDKNKVNKVGLAGAWPCVRWEDGGGKTLRTPTWVTNPKHPKTLK
jgi:hypothetical protein